MKIKEEKVFSVILVVMLIITLYSALGFNSEHNSRVKEEKKAYIYKELSINYSQEIKSIKLEKEQLNRTIQLHYWEYYNQSFNSSMVVASAYCYADIILIDIRGKKYWQALESFNHEWQHCKWGEHYEQARD